MIHRLLIVGLGSIGKRHLRLARLLLPSADIRVLRRQITKDVPEFADGCLFSLADAIAFAPQIAVVANPAPFHIETATELASAGVHLLIEKPLSTSEDGVSELIQICKARRVILSIGYNLRFLPSLQYYRNLLDSGIIGKVLSVRCEVGQHLSSWRNDKDYRIGVSAKRELGGGALFELSHEIDYLRWIFGEIDWVKATLSRQSKLEIDVEDTAHLTLGFRTKLDAHTLIATVNLDFIRRDATRYCVAIGEAASLRWDGLTNKVEIYKAEVMGWEELFYGSNNPEESYIAEWQNLINCVSANEIPLVTGEDGLKVLQIISAANRAALEMTAISVLSSSSMTQGSIQFRN